MKKKVWLTDVTEFRLDGKEDKLYLSPILDVLNKFEILEDLVIHSDQGFHYQHNSWVEKLKNRGIKQSMSRKGNCIDNSPMENFFGLLKQEMFYGEKFKSYQHLKIEIEEYIRCYNIDRIKEKLNGLSPVKYRLQSA